MNLWFRKTTTSHHTLAQVKEVLPRTGRESPNRGKGRGIAPLFLLPRLEMSVDGQCHTPAFLPREREAVSIVQRAEWTAGPLWAGFEP